MLEVRYARGWAEKGASGGRRTTRGRVVKWTVKGAVPAGMRCLRYGVCQGNARGTPRVRWGCGREGAVKGAVKGAVLVVGKGGHRYQKALRKGAVHFEGKMRSRMG